ncbi:MAG: hypothetical protein QW123_03260 [Desulfurococcaceae archaeon]|jgi:hypothetical protein
MYERFTMHAEISGNSIVIKKAWSSVAVTYVVRELSDLLMEKGYKPVVFFSGSPVVEEGGLQAEIKLDKRLSELDYALIKQLLENMGIEVVDLS